MKRLDLLIKRTIEDKICSALVPNKAIILLGPRRVGKTVLIDQLAKTLDAPYLLLNGEDFAVQEMLARRRVQHYRNFLGEKRILLIYEAQKIPNIGSILKLMVDGIEGEPLTGRKKTFHLLALSETEFAQIEDPIAKRDNLRTRLIYGNYPELIHMPELAEKQSYLSEIVNSYLLRDILAFENIRNSEKIINLLRYIAFQVGNEVSFNELGGSLGMSKNTVERYMDMLTKVFVLHRIGGFSRNLRKEVTKKSKWYFYDNGLRNVLIANMNPLELRNDIGQLWENYIISERIKHQRYSEMIVNNYFWRSFVQQVVDCVEELCGILFCFEFKWSPSKKTRPPKAWREAYPESIFEIVHQDNYRTFLQNPD